MKMVRTGILIILALLFVDNLKAQDNSESEYEVFILVENMPIFPDSSIYFLDYLNQNIQYSGNDTTIYFSFIIGKNGEVQNFELKRYDNVELKDKLENIIKKTSPWTPGIQNGRKVRVMYKYGVKLPGFINTNLREYFDLGDRYFEKNEYNKANKYYLTPLSLPDSYIDYGRKYYEIAENYYRKEDISNACKYFSIAIDCKDESSKSSAKKKYKKLCK